MPKSGQTANENESKHRLTLNVKKMIQKMTLKLSLSVESRACC